MQPVKALPVAIDLSSMSLTDQAVETIQFPRRPAYGRGGKPIRLSCNHYVASFNPKGTFWQYDFSIEDGDQLPPKKRTLLLSLLKQQHAARLGSSHIAFDGRAIAYAAPRLPFAHGSESFVVELEAAAEGRPAQTYTCKLQEAAQRNLSDLQAYLDGRRAEYASEAINALDVVSTATHYYSSLSTQWIRTGCIYIDRVRLVLLQCARAS
jgi:N-terminal domain of argonaute